jgi:hypothetical protein
MSDTILKYLKWAGWVALIIVIFLKFDSCGGYKEKWEALMNTNGSLNELVKNNQAEITRYKNNDVEQKQLILEMGKKESKLLVENDSLRKYVKRVESRLGFGTETNFAGITVPIGDGQTIQIRKRDLDKIQKMLKINGKVDSLTLIGFACCQQIDSLLGRDSVSSLLKLPFAFNYNTNQWLTLDGKVVKTGIEFNKIAVRDSFSILYYEKKQGLWGLGKPQSVVKITSANPYTTIKDVENVVVRPKKRFYQRPSFWTIVGFIGGAVTVNKLAK